MSTVSHSSLTPLRFLERSAEVYPDKVAIVHGDQRTSYRDFAFEATRLARALRASGIDPGDRVAYLCPNIPELLVAHFAVPLAGAVLVAINTRLASEEVRYICDHSGAKLLVVDSELRSIIDPVESRFETIREIVTVIDPVVERRHLPRFLPAFGIQTCSSVDPTSHCHGRWRTSSRRSRSITRRELRENPRESCTRIGARI